MLSGLGILSSICNAVEGFLPSFEAGSILNSDQVTQDFVQSGLEIPKDRDSTINLGCLLQIILTMKHFLCISSRNLPHFNS